MEFHCPDAERFPLSPERVAGGPPPLTPRPPALSRACRRQWPAFRFLHSQTGRGLAQRPRRPPATGQAPLAPASGEPPSRRDRRHGPLQARVRRDIGSASSASLALSAPSSRSGSRISQCKTLRKSSRRCPPAPMTQGQEPCMLRSEDADPPPLDTVQRKKRAAARSRPERAPAPGVRLHKTEPRARALDRRDPCRQGMPAAASVSVGWYAVTCSDPVGEWGRIASRGPPERPCIPANSPPPATPTAPPSRTWRTIGRYALRQETPPLVAVEDDEIKRVDLVDEEAAHRELDQGQLIRRSQIDALRQRQTRDVDKNHCRVRTQEVSPLAGNRMRRTEYERHAEPVAHILQRECGNALSSGHRRLERRPDLDRNGSRPLNGKPDGIRNAGHVRHLLATPRHPCLYA